jgi:hypothetical protein
MDLKQAILHLENKKRDITDNYSVFSEIVPETGKSLWKVY